MTRLTNANKKRRGAKLGQHLLINAGIAALVAKESGAEFGVHVYEIGPGKGMLTKELLALGAKVHAVEKDPLMVEHLRNAFPDALENKRLVIHEGDARELTPDVIFKKGEYVIAANIPYYITGELIRTALTAKNQPRQIALLVQKEVAERVARSKKESILSLSVKAYGLPKYIKTVSRGSFNPPPSVDSAVMRITDISRKNFKQVSEETFFKTVKAGFAQKRKTLSGNLKRAFGSAGASAISETEILMNARAEDISLPGWVMLSKKLARALGEK